MKAFKPEITTLKDKTVLTITTIGDPNKVAQSFLNALYSTAFEIKFKKYKVIGKKMEIGKLVGRWPDAHIKPKDQWTGIWGLPVSDFVKEKDLIQKDPKIKIKLEKWPYGTVTQILHKGSYAEEEPTIKMLHQFIEDEGYQIVGPHEEEYLTRPNVKEPKTIIRYLVKKKQR